MDKSLNSRRLLVTGGCGFIGSHFIRRILKDEDSRPARLLNVDCLTYAGSLANLAGVDDCPAYRMKSIDIRDERRITALLCEYKIDTVVNFAAETHVDRSIDSPEPFFGTNVIGTLRLLNAFRTHWRSANRPGSHRFLHVSTDEIYGTLAQGAPPFSEISPISPNSPYAASKASSDHIVRAFYQTYGLPVLITNSSNNYGPFQFPEKLIPLIIQNALEGRTLPVYGDGMQIRDWLFVDDHVDALCHVLIQGRIGERYNIGGQNQISNLEIVHSICRLLDRKHPRSDNRPYAEQISHVEDRPGHDRHYAMDCEKIRKELTWSPREGFLSGLEKTVDWYLANRDWITAATRNMYTFERLEVED